jgi:hypothetical protein
MKPILNFKVECNENLYADLPSADSDRSAKKMEYVEYFKYCIWEEW